MKEIFTPFHFAIKDQYTKPVKKLVKISSLQYDYRQRGGKQEQFQNPTYSDKSDVKHEGFDKSSKI